MKYIHLIIRLLVGLTFLTSGLTKLFPIEPFENTFIALGISNWSFVPFLARFVISFELFIGIAIILGLWLKNSVYYLAQGSLIFFTSYLIYLLVMEGNDVDCGCFGSLIQLSPLASIIKNVILFIFLLSIPKTTYAFKKKITLGLVLLCALTLPIILNPIGFHNIQGKETNEKVDFSEFPSLYQSHQTVNFSVGNKIVVFASYKCNHCINATRKLGLLKQQHQLDNLYLVVGSKEEAGLLKFIDATQTEFPIIWINDNSFFSYAGGKLPAIVNIEDGTIRKKWFGDLFDVDDLLNATKK